MNKEPERVLVDAAVAALKQLGLVVQARMAGRNRPDAAAILTIGHGGESVQYVAEVKRRIVRSLIGPITLAFTRPNENRLLLTDYLTPPIADALRRNRVQFLDTAGNAHLESDHFLIVISGRTLKSGPPAGNTLRVFHRNGLKILFVLLSSPSLASAPFRTMADAATVSLGSVPPVIDGLRDLGFLAEVNGARRLVNRDRLMDQWVEGYARRLQPSLEMGRFRAASPNWWRRVELTSYGAQWGGETAAALLHRHLQPEQVIVYADDVPAKLISDQRLKADSDGDIFVRRRFWTGLPSPRADLVPPLLIYADLLATGDARSITAANEIRETNLV